MSDAGEAASDAGEAASATGEAASATGEAASDAGGAASDDVLFAELRTLWEQVDPVPASLIDRMIAVVATADLSREYALLTLVAGAESTVRSETDALTLQFSDGVTSVLLHVTTDGSGGHRSDGWVDAGPAEIALTQGDLTRVTTSAEQGRFAFDGVGRGLTTVRLTARVGHELRTLATPQFEV